MIDHDRIVGWLWNKAETRMHFYIGIDSVCDRMTLFELDHVGLPDTGPMAGQCAICRRMLDRKTLGGTPR